MSNPQQPKAPIQINDPEELMELKDWWNKNGNLVSSILLVVALLFVGHKYYAQHLEKRADKASAEAAMASDVASFEKVVAEYPGSGDAPVALLRAALSSVREGTTESLQLAQEKYTQFLKKYGKHDLAPLARLGVAFTDEAMGNFAQAEKVYDEYLSEHKAKDVAADGVESTGTIGDGHYLIPVAILGRARCLALNNQVAAAQTALDQFIAAMPNTEWAVMADELKANVENLEFKAPEAAKSFESALDLLGGAEVKEAPAAEPAAAAEEPAAPAEAPAAEPAAEAVAE